LEFGQDGVEHAVDLINEWTFTPLRFLDDLTQPMRGRAQLGDDRKKGSASSAPRSRNWETSTASDEPSPSFLAAKLLKSVASDHKFAATAPTSLLPRNLRFSGGVSIAENG
jgi:hypothetical protein